MKFIWIAAGGAIGALLRYIISGMSYRFSAGVFPAGTLAVNLSGCLAIGFFWGFFERFDVAPQVRLFLFVGILGAFTTFSTFGLENINLLRDGEWRFFWANVLMTNAGGLLLIYAGLILSRWLTAAAR